MLVRELMTADPVAVTPQTPLATCRALLDAHGIRTLPVATDGKLVGLVCDGLAATGEGVAADRMTPADLVVEADEAAYEVLERAVWSSQDVVVVQDGGRLAGLVTGHDVCRLAARVIDPLEPLSNWASTGLVCIRPDATARVALDRMRRCFLRHLLVCDDRKLLGVVSIRDLQHDITLDEERPIELSLRGPVQWTVTWDVPMAEAVARMVRLRIGCLPILDTATGTIVGGVITRRDATRALLRSGVVGRPRTWNGGAPSHHKVTP